MIFGWFSRGKPVDTAVQRQSFQAGLVCGLDPETPYGIKAPDGLDSVAFVAGLIEGRSRLMGKGSGPRRGLRR